MSLLGDDEGADEPLIRINTSFAAEYQARKEKEELTRLKEEVKEEDEVRDYVKQRKRAGWLWFADSCSCSGLYLGERRRGGRGGDRGSGN